MGVWEDGFWKFEKGCDVLEADYLIIGTGALGMTFADQILTETDASVIMVDRHHMPGGHWNDAYSFVRLHQPSAFYGVGSRVLGSNRIDTSGYNKGYYELASGPEIQAYFDGLMRERFLPSGRVQYFPMSDYKGDCEFISLLSGKSQIVKVRKKIVDATFFNTSVPSTHEPRYEVKEGVKRITPNALPREAPLHSFYTIVGGGKTAMDVGVWLLDNQVDPDAIRWVMPRDSWLINRETTQPGDAFFHRFFGSKATQLEAAARASSQDDLFDRLERTGQLLRIDPKVKPAMYHGATISKGETDALGRITDVVRLGHVKTIEPDGVVLAEGRVPANPGDLYIDCTASAIARRPVRPIFEGDHITLQMIRAGLFTFSIAVIAFLEATCDDDEMKNHLAPPLSAPDVPADWIRLFQAENEIQKRWSTDLGLKTWISEHRLSGANLRTVSNEPDPEAQAIRTRIREYAPLAGEKLPQLLAEQ